MDPRLQNCDDGRPVLLEGLYPKLYRCPSEQSRRPTSDSEVAFALPYETDKASGGECCTPERVSNRFLRIAKFRLLPSSCMKRRAKLGNGVDTDSWPGVTIGVESGSARNAATAIA